MFYGLYGRREMRARAHSFQDVASQARSQLSLFAISKTAVGVKRGGQKVPWRAPAVGWLKATW